MVQIRGPHALLRGYTLYRNHVVRRVFLADFPRGLVFRRMAPSQEVLHTVPAYDDDTPFRRLAINGSSFTSGDILSSMRLERGLSGRKIVPGISLAVGDLIVGNHVDGRFCLRMKRVECAGAYPRASQHRQ